MNAPLDNGATVESYNGQTGQETYDPVQKRDYKKKRAVFRKKCYSYLTSCRPQLESWSFSGLRSQLSGIFYLNDIKIYPSGIRCFHVVIVDWSLIPLALIVYVLVNQIIDHPKNYWLKSTILFAYDTVGQPTGLSVRWLSGSICHWLESLIWLHLLGGWADRTKMITHLSSTSALYPMVFLSPMVSLGFLTAWKSQGSQTSYISSALCQSQSQAQSRLD